MLLRFIPTKARRCLLYPARNRKARLQTWTEPAFPLPEHRRYAAAADPSLAVAIS